MEELIKQVQQYNRERGELPEYMEMARDIYEFAFKPWLKKQEDYLTEKAFGINNFTIQNKMNCKVKLYYSDGLEEIK